MILPQLSRAACAITSIASGWRERTVRLVAPESSHARKRRLIRSGGFYRPDGLLEGLAPVIADPTSGIVDMHLYTFNAVDVTERWRQGFLEKLAVPSHFSPYGWVTLWKAAALPEGTYTLRSIAYDDAGITGRSEPVPRRPTTQPRAPTR